MERLTCRTQHYAWGSTTALPRMRGVEPDGTPQAELWIGAHPVAPSCLPDGRTLDAAIAAAPRRLLGDAVADRFANRLPYLVKLLAASAPLSIQAHPSDAQAVAGFAAEEAAGIPSDAPDRLYRDASSKPEMIVALTPFTGLCGLRPVEASLNLLERLGVAGRAPFTRLAADGPAAVIGALLRVRDADLADAVTTGAAADPSNEAAWLRFIAAAFPSDPGISVAALMNVVTLAPGEALFLPAGNLHAYLDGLGLEIMASSDNVLRGGLTPKHIAVNALLDVLDPTTALPTVLHATRDGAAVGVHLYTAPTAAFSLAIADVTEDDTTTGDAACAGVPRLLLGLGGTVVASAGGSSLTVGPTDAVWIPAGDDDLVLSGVGRVAIARPGT